MENTGQSLTSHTRWHTPFHFVALPIVLIHFVWSAMLLWRAPGWPAFEGLLLAIALVIVTLLTRINPLKAQDRVIRLEEQLRLHRLLPPAAASEASAKLTESQFVALRFASDAELPGLVGKVMAGNPSAPADIKKAIQNWRGDYFRV